MCVLPHSAGCHQVALPSLIIKDVRRQGRKGGDVRRLHVQASAGGQLPTWIPKRRMNPRMTGPLTPVLTLNETFGIALCYLSRKHAAFSHTRTLSVCATCFISTSACWTPGFEVNMPLKVKGGHKCTGACLQTAINCESQQG